MPDCQTRLFLALDAARGRPFAWGVHDCATWAFDLRRDLTGGADIAARWRGRYSTARGAHRVMRRLGWESLEAMGRDLLGDPLATPLLAQRGDLMLGGADPAFGICAGARAAFVAPKGLTFLPLSACVLAWRV
ncbi:hypothetical protein SAMN04490248_12041 [Salinihabitans flavidus]|uniref:DUF6950 domain-containing protein n=1 Tax=Salinihabitans flavidus TaxID=569882 RepID=A0A1H8UIJ8_9RHOB|nr:hypothetical protein [Salinihabitans flavidus]SEP02981.1 hypothetical protein SAMN04490248_12041 [Salinihabitans flavidus]